MSKIADGYEAQVKNSIRSWGRDVSIIWGSTVTCSSCGYDPISHEATNPACSTCGGKYFYQIESTYPVKGVLKTFIGNMKYQDYALEKFGFVPQSDARLTFWLPDILIDCDSATGYTYLDKSIRIEVDGLKYKIKNTYRTGVNDLVVLVSTLEEIK